MPQQHEIKINLPGLLKMLGSNIYSEPDVAVREMIQNAHDTCIIRQSREPGFTIPEIRVDFDERRRTLTFSDNGEGMTEQDLHEMLSTIGKSFTKEARENLKSASRQEALLLIGQFGIGLLSAFAVANKVEIFTKSHLDGATGFKWICEGDIHYSVEPLDKADCGTKVVLHLNDASLVLLDQTRLRQTIKKYADFLIVPIFLRGQQVNSCTPPWLKTDEHLDFGAYINDRYGLYALAILPIQIAEPLPLDGLLFVPMIPYELTRDFGELDIYISRMFNRANDKDLLPKWARFIKGVINTPALLPTVSRDEIVRDAAYQTIRNMLGELILEFLGYLKDNDPQRLDLVVGTYNNTIKARSVDDDGFFDRICDLVRMQTSDGNMSMREYLDKTQNIIYYFSERGSGTQHKLLFAHKNLPVIDASWGMEEEFLEKYARRRNVKLERLEAGSGIIFKEETTDEKWRDLERQFELNVRKKAKAASFEPSTVPAVLISQPTDQTGKLMAEVDALGQQAGLKSDDIRRMFQSMGKGKLLRATGEDMIIRLNITNPLMQQLRDMPRNETFRLALTVIYNNALMFTQHFVSPENAEIIFQTNNSAFSTMITNVQSLQEAQGQLAKMEIELTKLKANLLKFESPKSDQQQKRLLDEYKSLLEIYDTHSKKIYELRRKYAIETDVNVKFKLKTCLDEEEADRDNVEKKVAALEAELAKYSDMTQETDVLFKRIAQLRDAVHNSSQTNQIAH